VIAFFRDSALRVSEREPSNLFVGEAAKDRGVLWCCCASLAQLLPVIRINKELTDFFDDPQRTRLKGWQVFVFSALGVVGLALGAILLIAVSGLTHSA
jgi:hypothetical protein